MTLNYKKVEYKKSKYAVVDIVYKDNTKPVVLNWKDFLHIKEFGKSWKCNKNNMVSCSHTFQNSTKEIFIHDVIMALNKERIDAPILHINTNGLDNRRENLLYDTCDKDCSKNVKKKARTIKLPKTSGIKPDDIPTYIWYLKPNGSHGERFMIDTGEYKWKTTSSKAVSLKEKLEQAKEYLRTLRITKAHVFEDKCMNGEMTQKGKDLFKSYANIIEKAGYEVDNLSLDGITDKYLKAKK